MSKWTIPKKHTDKHKKKLEDYNREKRQKYIGVLFFVSSKDWRSSSVLPWHCRAETYPILSIQVRRNLTQFHWTKSSSLRILPKIHQTHMYFIISWYRNPLFQKAYPMLLRELSCTWTFQYQSSRNTTPHTPWEPQA